VLTPQTAAAAWIPVRRKSNTVASDDRNPETMRCEHLTDPMLWFPYTKAGHLRPKATPQHAQALVRWPSGSTSQARQSRPTNAATRGFR
jgi:hypothetical protein